ncbi:MAG: hypothetical protein Q7J86_00460, partial [Bacteroidota bacterium]|nr:hypothetical protein [Bacteroidota bacterium]
MKINIFLLCVLISVLFSCGNQPHKQIRPDSNQFAHGFHIVRMGEITRLDVFNPWENARNFVYSYYLIPKSIA